MTSFKITKKNFIYDTDTLTDLISPNHSNIIIKSKIMDEYPEELAKLKTLKIKKNNVIVRYRRDFKFGRHYPKKHCYTYMNKKIRNSLFNDKYLDIDMINSHYAIIIGLCKKFKYTGHIENIEKYYSNRTEIIDNLMKNNDKTKGEIKKSFLSLLYGGAVDLHCDNDNLVENIKDEITGLRNQVLLDNPSIYKYILKKKADEKTDEEVKWSAFSIYIQEWENRTLEKIFIYLKNNKMIKENICSLMYDGLTLLKNDKITEDVLRKIETKIKDELNIDIKLIFKDTSNKLFDFTKLSKKVEVTDTNGKFNLKYMEKLPNYLSKKEYIEIFWTKINYPEIHYICNYNNTQDNKIEKIIYKHDDMKKLLIPITSGVYDDMGNELPFFKCWTKDINQKSKDKVDFIPINPDEEYKIDSDIYNLFTGYDKRIRTEYNKENTDRILKPYLDLIYQICNKEDKVYDYYLKYMANLIQEPRNKPGICIEIRGKQGTGKNISYLPIKNIIGEDHFISSSNPETFFDTHAIGYMNKLLVIMDEIDFSKVKKYESLLKTNITEDKIAFNPKNLKPFMTHNHSRTATITNKRNGAPIDFSSNDRRYVVIKASSDWIRTKSRTFWSKLVKHFNKPEFISCLYDYFMNVDYTGIDWIKERPITEEYKRTKKQFIPSECLFLTSEIISSCIIVDDDSDDEDEEEETDEDKNILKYSKRAFYEKYKNYIESNSLMGKNLPSISTFVRGMEDHFDNGVKFTNDEVEIDIKNCKETLIINKHIDDELDEYKYLTDVKEYDCENDYFDI